MSLSGLVGTYVNPAGFVHETITIRKAQGLLAFGKPTEKETWFPGYGWSIAYCKKCSSHIGWRFDARKGLNLEPPSFWGIRRATICQSTK
jgi:cereblon